MSVYRNEEMSTILYCVMSMSFKMRATMYDMAQSYGPTSRTVIVAFSVGRFQDPRQMKFGAYIAIDPEIKIPRRSPGRGRGSYPAT